MTARTVSGRIPIRLEPVRGESFDGWLDAYAQRLRVSTVDLANALEVPPAFRRFRGPKLALAQPAPDPELIAARAGGIDPPQIEALWIGLARYDRLLGQRLRTSILMRAARLLSSSRFCPSCLHEGGGRWLAAWRLPWYLACPVHHTMLAYSCACCGGAQRDGVLRAEYCESLTTACCRPTVDATGRGDNRCRHDLTVDPAPAPARPELIALQAELITILEPTLAARDADRLVDRLADLLTVAWHVGLDPRAFDGNRLNAASVLADPLIEAHGVLADPGGARLRALVSGDGPPMLPATWRSASPALMGIVMRHRDARLRATDRLRQRSMTGAGRRPEGVDPATRVHALPLALWPDWSIRLRPPTIEARNFRVSASAALCLPGATATLNEIGSHWPTTRLGINLTHLCRIIARDEHGRAILAALCALADELDRHGAPIDYSRRRDLASQITLLDANTWVIMCRAGGTHPGGASRLRQARVYLWETLTGGIAEQAPQPLRIESRMGPARYQTFALRLPGRTARMLREHARTLLDDHGCRDEPLTWSPPGAGVAVADLPGPDPDTVEPQPAHALLARRMAPGEVADALGITIEHLRYIIRANPDDGEQALAPGAPARVRLAASTTPDELRSLVGDGHRLRDIAHRHDVGRGTLRAQLVAHGIPIPPKNPPAHRIDRDWLHEQYVVKQRTMPDIAAETGASGGTIWRLIHEYEIPARGRGTPSHQQSLTAGDGYPDPLARAVLRPGGHERVKRFQVYARTRSLTVAATRLGVHQATLTTQLTMLENACEGQLLDRLTRDQRPQQLTELGRVLLDQADRHLGPHPDAPPDLPMPLAAALAAHWGPKMVATLAAAVRFPTLTEAADGLGRNCSSVLRTIRNIEGAVGAPVITEHARSAPLRLTPIGRRLLGQAREHPELVATTPAVLPCVGSDRATIEDRVAGSTRSVAITHLLSAPGSRLLDAPIVLPRPAVGPVLANLDKTQFRDLGERAAHVLELTTGYRSGDAGDALPGEPREPFRPGTARMDRYKANAAELGVGVRTIRRWVTAFERDREAGLVAGR